MKNRRWVAIGMSIMLVLAQSLYVCAEDYSEDGYVAENSVEEDLIEEDLIEEDCIEENCVEEDLIEEDRIEENCEEENFMEEDCVEEDCVEEEICSDEIIEFAESEMENFGYIEEDFAAPYLIGTDDYETISVLEYDPEGDADAEIVGAGESDGESSVASISYYDGRDYGYLSQQTRNQGDTGTCWAHSVLGAIETELRKNDGATSDINLSELQLAYFAVHGADDPKDCHDDDSVWTEGSNYLNNGGNDSLAYHTIINMMGPVNEQLAPLSKGSSYEVPDYYAYGMREVQIKQVLAIPLGDRDGIKEAVLQYGGVTATFYAREKITGTVSETHKVTMSNGDVYTLGYNKEHNAYYGDAKSTNHEVIIVGWDDNFPKEYFNAGCRPEGNGAWLVKNSWGGNGDGYKGYFWLSYYDGGLNAYSNGSASKPMYAYDASIVTNDNVYAYDSNPVQHLRTGINTTKLTVAQDYYVDAGEEIKSVGFETYCTQMAVGVTVSDGVNTVSGTTTTSYAGFYTVDFSEGLKMYEAGRVTVTITYESLVGEIVFVTVEPNESDKLYALKGNSNATYFKSVHNNKANSRRVNENGSTSAMPYDLCIKLYTDNINPTYEVVGVEASLTDSIELAVILKTTGVNLDYLFGVEYEPEDNELETLGAYNGILLNVGFAGDGASIMNSELAEETYLWESIEFGTTTGKEFLYKIKYKVPIKDMGKDIQFGLTDGINKIALVNGNCADGFEYKTSVNEYLLELSNNSKNAELVDLAQSLLIYGQVAAFYFGDDSVVDDAGVIKQLCAEGIYEQKIDKFISESGKLSQNEKTFYIAENSGIRYLGSSLVIASETSIRHYFSLEEGCLLENFSFTVDGLEASAVGNEAIFYVEVPNIYVTDFNSDDTVLIKNASGTVAYMNYSVYSYVNDVISAEPEGLFTEGYDRIDEESAIYLLARMIYLYGNYATKYVSGVKW